MFKPLINNPGRMNSIDGGRGGMKTTAVARIFAYDGVQEPLNMICCRTQKADIEEGPQRAIIRAISDLGLGDHYRIYKDKIIGIGPSNQGGVITFHGLERGRKNLPGLENVHRLWVDESQGLTGPTMDLLLPTMREPGHRLYFTWNPTRRSDWVYQRFIVNPDPDDVVIRNCSYDKNIWKSPETISQYEYDKKYNPRFEHIWKGQLDDEDGHTRRILPFAMAEGCVEAFREAQRSLGEDIFQRYFLGVRDLGLDLADTGNGFTSMADRQGPVLWEVTRWRGQDLRASAERTDIHARKVGASHIYYDAGGIGAGIRTHFRDLTGSEYMLVPELFNGKVKGPTRIYANRVMNGDFFKARSAQLGWAIRLRANNTMRYMNGEDVYIDDCLFINPEMEYLDALLDQLCQPVWEEAVSNGKMEVHKTQGSEPSPDMYDATVLSFARDSIRGLGISNSF